MSNQLVGIGLRHSHIEKFATQKPNVGWVEERWTPKIGQCVKV